MATHRRRMSKLSLEPNPFEQSFSLVRSKGVPVSVDVEDTLAVHGPPRDGLSSRPHRTPSPGEPIRAGSEADGDSSSRTEAGTERGGESRHTQKHQQGDGQQARPSSTPVEGRTEQNVKLPPITAIDVPMSGVTASGGWGAESLRSGPLSPAMLGGPAGPTTKPTGRPTPRLGVSDPLLHTGLTPFIAGETHPTTGAGLEGGRLAPALATPGLQAVIRAAFDGKEIAATPGGTLHLADPQHPPLRRTSEAALAGVAMSMSASHDVAAALSTMADTRLLPPAAGEGASGATQPMASLPDAGPADNLPIVTGAMSLVTRPLPAPELPATSPVAATPPSRRAKRRRDAPAPASSQSLPPQSQPAPQSLPQSAPSGPPARAKRARSAGTKPSRSRAPAKGAKAAAVQKKAARSAGSSGDSDAEEGGADDGDSDDKRRQFLERNRIAALKCRQRKKRQLQELQERHDYMMAENERLRSEFAQMRETALRVRTLLAAHSECSVARANGVLGADNLPMGTPSVSMRPLLLPAADSSEGEHARQIIAAIPPTSNGVPIHDVNMAVGTAEQQRHSFGPAPVHPAVLAPSVVSQNQNIQFGSVPIVPPAAAAAAAANPQIFHTNPQPSQS
ncbi:Transcription factor [Coemansia guatemalensis]|uniref:Transcription factor n=1 Tax=Coemansia guatemalensis TaxID=2761395 RepID=A0A9W8I0D8_9FUNG|nr:Transcription factor [Coemansia guatemalensis]